MQHFVPNGLQNTLWSLVNLLHNTVHTSMYIYHVHMWEIPFSPFQFTSLFDSPLCMCVCMHVCVEQRERQILPTVFLCDPDSEKKT